MHNLNENNKMREYISFLSQFLRHFRQLSHIFIVFLLSLHIIFVPKEGIWIWCCNKARSFTMCSITTIDIKSNDLDYKAVLWSWPLNQIERSWYATASCCNSRKSKCKI